MHGNRALLPILLALLVVAGCGSDGATGTPDPTVLEFQGQILSDAWDQPLQAPVLLRVFRSDGSGGWNETVPNEVGNWAMEVELREGCEPGETLEAAAWIPARDHRAVDEDLGGGHPVLCDPEPQMLDYSLFREIFREPVPVAGDLQASGVAGFHWTCAVADQGTSCWGTDRPAPVAVSGGGSFHGLEAGFLHTCALDGEEAAWCWGSNTNGVLGVPGTEESSDPLPVETDLRFVELAANSESTCGRDGEGRLHCWGMYGDETPVAFGGDLRFEQISGQWTHMCGVEAGTGRVWCWGNNARGELAQEEQERFEEPVLVEGVEDAELVRAGAMFTCALDQGRNLHCWGWNCDGQLGRVGGPQNHTVPQVVEAAPPLVQIALGYGFVCGLTEEGEAWCWGRNSRGELGADTGPSHWSVEPVPVSGDLRFTDLSAGWRHACGITDEGKLYCWGDRSYLGTGLPLTPDATAPQAAREPWSADPMAGTSFPAGGSCS